MNAGDVMTSSVIAVQPQTDVREIAGLLLDFCISAVPVVDEAGRVLGIVSEGDLIDRPEAGTRHRKSWWLENFRSAEGRAEDYLRSHGRRAEDVMTREVISVSEDAPLGEVARLLEKHGIKRVPVVRDGRLVGIVSRANLLHGLAAAERLEPPEQGDRQARRTLNENLGAAGLPMHQVNATVHDGVAELWGWIDAEVQRQAARAAAEATPGVEEIEDHLVLASAATRAGRGYV